MWLLVMASTFYRYGQDDSCSLAASHDVGINTVPLEIECIGCWCEGVVLPSEPLATYRASGSEFLPRTPSIC